MDRERISTRNRPAPVSPTPSFRDAASAWGDLTSNMADAFDTFFDTLTLEETAKVRTRRRHRSERGNYRECKPDPCHCDCCVHDADLVVYARLGETRIVPIRIENERSRTRQVALELSGFTTSGGKEVPIQGAIVSRKEFELEACAHEDAVLGLQIRQERESKADEARRAAESVDVDDCVVGYADLRIEGCNVRPVRVAVAILPRDCDAYEVHCACGCC